MSYSLHIRTSPTGGDLIRTHGKVASLTFAYDKHGCAELTAELAVSVATAYQVYDAPGLLHIVVCYQGAIIWSGRLHEATVSSAGLRLVAHGYWDALRDVPYTALWSSTAVNEFRPVVIQEIANAYPSRFTMDTNNRIFITANKGETLGTTTIAKIGYQAFEAPSQGQRDFITLSFDYEAFAPVNWRFGSNTYTNAALPWTVVAGVWSVNATGVLQTGTQTLTIAACDVITFWLYYNAADAVNAAETGSTYLRITNIRIATQATPVYGSDIAGAMATYADNVNGLLAGSVVTVSSLDLKDEQYNDALPAEIIDRVAGIDGARAYVDSDRVFWYGTTSDGHWQLDITDLEVQRSLERVFNRAYGVYQDASGRILRTADADNTFSQSRYGVIRATPVDVSSTNTTQVATQRDASLVDTALPSPRAGITVRRILDRTGQPTLPHLPRAGDQVVIPTLPPSLSTTVDQIRAFVIGRVEVSLSSGELPQVTIEPREPVATLATLLARAEALTQRVSWSPNDDVPQSLPFDGARFDFGEIRG